MKQSPKESFPHDADARKDPAIQELIKRYPKSGYGYWWIVVELLRSAPDFKLARTINVFTDICTELGEEPVFVKQFMTDLVALNLLQRDEFSYWSEELIRRMKIKTNRTIKSKSLGFKLLTEPEFYQEVLKFKGKFTSQMLEEFFDYWREQDARGRMRFQLQDTWDTNLRLKKWARNNFGSQPQGSFGKTPVVEMPKRTREDLQSHWQHKFTNTN